MAGRIIIERLEFYGRCGVTEEERRKPQLIAVDLELDTALEPAGLSDRLDDTVDYARVADRVVALSTGLTCQLLETLAEQLLDLLFAEFPVERVQLWIRKLHAPLAMVAGSVGVRYERTRAAQQPAQPTPCRSSSNNRAESPKVSFWMSPQAEAAMPCTCCPRDHR